MKAAQSQRSAWEGASARGVRWRWWGGVCGARGCKYSYKRRYITAAGGVEGGGGGGRWHGGAPANAPVMTTRTPRISQR